LQIKWMSVKRFGALTGLDEVVGLQITGGGLKR
jgi:hypothetical protein